MPSPVSAPLDEQPTPAPPIDISRLQLVADSQEDMAVVLTLFFDVAREYVTLMEHAESNKKLIVWSKAAHSLRGAAANLGMPELQNLCKRSEQLTSYCTENFSQCLTAIKGEIKRIRDYIDKSYPLLLSVED